MPINQLNNSSTARLLSYASLIIWGGCVLALLRHDAFSINEGAAQAILFSWSIADQVASSVITLGPPDLRVLLFLPIGFLWTGSVFAAKILMLGIAAYIARLLFQWRQNITDTETALISTGLFMISPILIAQLDALDPGPLLIAAFIIGTMANSYYLLAPNSYNGWFFAQLFICAFSTSLHPAGFAYPLALIWSSVNSSIEPRQKKLLLSGAIFSSLLIPALRFGWNDLIWLHNPIDSLGEYFTPQSLITPQQTGTTLLVGGVIFTLLIVVVAFQRKSIRSDFFGRTLLIATILGIFVSNTSWPIIATSIIIFFGTPLLLRPLTTSIQPGFWSQRGFALSVVFICSLIFMQTDKFIFERNRNNDLSEQDQLINTLSQEAESWRLSTDELSDDAKPRQRFIVASQWPSRTMIACKCDTLPLPPATEDPQSQLRALRGISHLILDPKQTTSLDLVKNLSLLGGEVETVSLQEGGVMLHVKYTPENNRDTSK